MVDIGGKTSLQERGQCITDPYRIAVSTEQEFGPDPLDTYAMKINGTLWFKEHY
jgi:hypothetical protein